MVNNHQAVLQHRPQPWLKPAGIIGVGLAVFVVSAGLVSRSLAHQNLKTWTAAQAIPTVQVVAPASDTSAETLVLPGAVQAYYNATIHARVSGYLKRWYQDIGAHVVSGQLLAEIDTPELDQQLAQAKANLATAVSNEKLAQITATRWKGLLSQDAVSRQETDEKSGDQEAKMSVVAAAKAEVDRLQALEAFKRIVAPFDGVVTARTTDVGALIAAGAPNDAGLFTVSDVHKLRIYVHVPQSYGASIHPGASASLTVPDYPGKTFTATLVGTSESVSDQSGTVLVELQTDSDGGLLKPGDYAQVSFALPRTGGVVNAPASALMFRQKGMAVAVVGPDSHVTLKPVTIGRDFGASVEIASGLTPSDRLIDNPPDSLKQGDLVRVAGGDKTSPTVKGS